MEGSKLLPSPIIYITESAERGTEGAERDTEGAETISVFSVSSLCALCVFLCAL
jgi:hypothetical protein